MGDPRVRCECGGDSGVTDTRDTGDGIYRRRRCKICRTSWVTIESRKSDVLVITRAEAYAILGKRADE